MSELQGLLFDVDGTLADTERDGHRVAFNQAFAAAGLNWEWDDALYGELLRVTGGKERIRHYLDTYLPDFKRPHAYEAFVTGLHHAKNRIYAELLATGGIPLRPGVRRLLEEARAAGLRLAVATTTSPENVSALLAHALAADGESWFEVIAAGDIVPAKKPAPDIYTWALKEMDLKPEQALAFEDSENGVRASLGAGLKTIVTVNEYTRTHDFSGAALVVDQLGEPGAPFKILKGQASGPMYVDVALLRKVHAEAKAV